MSEWSGPEGCSPKAGGPPDRAATGGGVTGRHRASAGAPMLRADADGAWWRRRSRGSACSARGSYRHLSPNGHAEVRGEGRGDVARVGLAVTAMKDAAAI